MTYFYSLTTAVAVILMIAALQAMLSGPGIQSRQALAAAGLPEGFWREWRLNHQRFPLGVDVLLTQGRRICGLPRSTRLEN